jgi:hypothetical protein
MNERLGRLLDHLAATLDPRRQAEIDLLHRKTLNWEPVARLPLVLAYPIPADAVFQPYPHREVFDDPEKMLYNELLHGFDASIASRDQLDDDLALTIRVNFGTVIIASMFGACVEQVQDNPPWVRHFETIDDTSSTNKHWRRTRKLRASCVLYSQICKGHWIRRNCYGEAKSTSTCTAIPS